MPFAERSGHLRPVGSRARSHVGQDHLRQQAVADNPKQGSAAVAHEVRTVDASESNTETVTSISHAYEVRKRPACCIPPEE
jgi:hypothetical protein